MLRFFIKLIAPEAQIGGGISPLHVDRIPMWMQAANYSLAILVASLFISTATAQIYIWATR